MMGFRTTAVLEDARHLRLSEPLTDAVGTVLEVVITTAEAPVIPANGGQNFQDALGSYYREYPTDVKRSSDEWLAELRDGEAD